jgi:hypothetical protein
MIDMDFAFSENASKPSTLGKSHTLIAKLWQHCADISEQLSNTHAKLQTNSSNSSLPPGSGFAPSFCVSENHCGNSLRMAK